VVWLLLLPCLVDHLRIAGGLSARCSSSRCSSCSSQVPERFHFDPLWQLFLVGRSLADHPPGCRGPSVRHQLLTDRPRARRGPSIFRGALLEVLLAFSDCPSESRGLSVRALWTICLVSADCPPGASQSC
jgi:hypothetical protein